MFGVMDTSASGLVTQRIVMDAVAGNVANMESTRDLQGRPNPYQRRVPLLAPGRLEEGVEKPGVRVQAIVKDPSPFELRYQPDHPDAVREGALKGYVRFPNVDQHTEMLNMMVALRAYEANITVMEAAKSAFRSSLRLLA